MEETVGDITIHREGNGLETQWELIGPNGTWPFRATDDGTLPLTAAGLAQVGVTAANQDAVIQAVWKFTPAEVRRLTLDGTVVKKHGL